MPRKGNIPKREVLPDPIYGSVVVAKLINSIMLTERRGSPSPSYTMRSKPSKSRLAKIRWKYSKKR